MRSQWKRLLWAALLSCSCCGVTIAWHELTKNKNTMNENEKPLAYVGHVVDEIERRPAARLLWQEVNTGEPLYNGEAIRTSDKGEVRIQFADSKRYLDLEPDSLIVIQQSKGEIALDLMEGSLYVAAAQGAADEAATSLVLNSASGKVDLSKASANLTKSKGNQLDMQILQGSASVKDRDGKSKVLNTGSSGELSSNGLQFNKADLQILSPVSGKVAYVDPDTKDGMSFQWKGFPSNLKIALYVGNSRKDLKEWPSSTDDKNGESLKATLPVGKPYWKLVAKDPKTQKVVAESSIYRTEVQARYAPTVIFPMADAKIPATKGPYEMAFKWQKGDETNRVVLEVAKDPLLKEKIVTKAFTDEDSFTLPALNPGDYYWRMSSYYEGTNKATSGKIQKFSLLKAEEKVIPKEPLQIAWTVPEDKIQFYIDNPKMDLSWNVNRPADVAGWKLKYFEENEDPAKSQTVDLKEPKAAAKLTKPGRYIASVEAVDKSGNVIGASPQAKIAVAPLPLLPAPKLLPEEGNITASADGRTEISWQKMDGVKEYVLTIADKNGKDLKTLKYTSTQTSLKNLMPGEYQVKLLAVDQHGRNSEAGTPRKLIVPDKSNLKAPTLKKIKVN